MFNTLNISLQMCGNCTINTLQAISSLSVKQLHDGSVLKECYTTIVTYLITQITQLYSVIVYRVQLPTNGKIQCKYSKLFKYINIWIT